MSRDWPLLPADGEADRRFPEMLGQRVPLLYPVAF